MSYICLLSGLFGLLCSIMYMLDLLFRTLDIVHLEEIVRVVRLNIVERPNGRSLLIGCIELLVCSSF